jgi:hypothetical protein
MPYELFVFTSTDVVSSSVKLSNQNIFINLKKMNSKKPFIWFIIVIFFGLNILFQIFFITNEKKEGNSGIHFSSSSTNEKTKEDVYEPLSKLSQDFPRIQVVIPTMYRLKTGYTYLTKTFNSLNTSFKSLNVDFTLNAFERKSLFNNAIPFQGGDNFKLNYFEQNQNLIKFLKDPEHEFVKINFLKKDCPF